MLQSRWLSATFKMHKFLLWRYALLWSSEAKRMWRWLHLWSKWIIELKSRKFSTFSNSKFKILIFVSTERMLELYSDRNLTWNFQQLLTGEMCCYDLSAAEQWSMGELRWIKKCCNNPSGHPVLRPTRNLSQQQLKKVSRIDILHSFA